LRTRTADDCIRTGRHAAETADREAADRRATAARQVLAGPDSAERDEMPEWVDEDFDPSHFDLAAANATVSAV
jgi:hypothetical protein